MKKTVLGRGLDALMPEVEYAGAQVLEVDVQDIDNNPGQPRKSFEKEKLEELAESILSVGILQPLLVKQKGGRYQIVAGERRFRAARLAGLKTVPVIVRDYTKKEQLEAALIENLQRQDLNPIEEAQALKELLDNNNYTQETLAKRIGRSRPAVANILRLLTLPEDIMELIRQGKLSEGHGRVLAGVSPAQRQRALAERAVVDFWSVRQLEKAAKEVAKKAPTPPQTSPEFKEFEENIHRALGAKASITGNLNKGKIVISYKNREELDAVFDAVSRLL